MKNKKIPKEAYDTKPYANYNTLLTFGKYKSILLGWVIENNPWYVKWMHDNNVIKIEPPILERVNELINVSEDYPLNPNWD